jgi:hypothetical protein
MFACVCVFFTIEGSGGWNNQHDALSVCVVCDEFDFLFFCCDLFATFHLIGHA